MIGRTTVSAQPSRGGTLGSKDGGNAVTALGSSDEDDVGSDLEEITPDNRSGGEVPGQTQPEASTSDYLSLAEAHKELQRVQQLTLEHRRELEAYDATVPAKRSAKDVRAEKEILDEMQNQPLEVIQTALKDAMSGVIKIAVSSGHLKGTDIKSLKRYAQVGMMAGTVLEAEAKPRKS